MCVCVCVCVYIYINHKKTKRYNHQVPKTVRVPGNTKNHWKRNLQIIKNKR